MIPERVVIIGGGGFAREVLDVLEAVNAVRHRYDVLGFIVDPEYGSPGTVLNDVAVVGGFDWLSRHAGQVSAICAVGDPRLRRRLTDAARAAGASFCSVEHPTVVRSRWIRIGAGCVITAGCVLTNQIRLGDHVQVNLSCTIGHDVVLEDFATLAPGVNVSGNAHLEEGCYVGTGASILPKVRIGAWSTVGAGAAITRDVPPGATVVGVPGRVIKTASGERRE